MLTASYKIRTRVAVFISYDGHLQRAPYIQRSSQAIVRWTAAWSSTGCTVGTPHFVRCGWLSLGTDCRTEWNKKNFVGRRNVIVKNQRPGACCRGSHILLDQKNYHQERRLYVGILGIRFCFFFLLLVKLTRGLYGFDQNLRPTNLVLKVSRHCGVKLFSGRKCADHDERLLQLRTFILSHEYSAQNEFRLLTSSVSLIKTLWACPREN